MSSTVITPYSPRCTYRIRHAEARQDIYRSPGWHRSRHKLWAIDTGPAIGTGLFRVDGTLYRRNESSVALYAPGTVYEEYWEMGAFVSWSWLLIEETGTPSALSKLTGTNPFCFLHDPAQTIRKKITLILDAENDSPVVRPFRLTALLYEILGILFQLHLKSLPAFTEHKAQHPWRHPWRKMVHQLLETSPAKKLTIPELAKALETSPSALTHSYKMQCGESFQDTVQRWRVEKARVLLARKDLSIKQIAGLIGFSQQSYFSTFFKTITGYNPSDYRRFTLQ